MPETTTTEQLREQVRDALRRGRGDRHLGAGRRRRAATTLRRRRLVLRPDRLEVDDTFGSALYAADGPGQPAGGSRGGQPGLRQPDRGGGAPAG